MNAYNWSHNSGQLMDAHAGRKRKHQHGHCSGYNEDTASHQPFSLNRIGSHARFGRWVVQLILTARQAGNSDIEECGATVVFRCLAIFIWTTPVLVPILPRGSPTNVRFEGDTSTCAHVLRRLDQRIPLGNALMTMVRTHRARIIVRSKSGGSLYYGSEHASELRPPRLTCPSGGGDLTSRR